MCVCSCVCVFMCVRVHVCECRCAWVMQPTQMSEDNLRCWSLTSIVFIAVYAILAGTQSQFVILLLIRSSRITNDITESLFMGIQTRISHSAASSLPMEL